MLRGLYAITDPVLTPPNAIVEQVEQVILGGARLVQYRDKSTVDQALRKRQAAALARLCDDYGVLLIINDHVELAHEVGAHGVHLGVDDMRIREARTLLGEDALIGASCYNDLGRAQRARDNGANYVAFGSFFPSPSKPRATRVEPDILGLARRRLAMPICAIGGITADNAAPLIRAGASLLAVISGVFAQPNPQLAAHKLAALLN
jgi:thiamine-phosphate pyrophosphorylase